MAQNATTQINTGFQTPQARTEKELPKDVKATGLALFEQQVDCSSVVDLFGDGPIPQPYRLRFSSPDATIMLHENFTLIVDQQENVSVRVHLLLTAEVLVICKVLKNGRYSLMYPPLFVSDITAKSISLDRELMGEYLLQLTVMGRKTLTMRADTREIRNVWVGVDGSAPSSTTLTPRPLKKTVQRLLESPDCPVPFELNPPATAPLNNSASAPIRKEDLFSFSNDHGGMISPLEESDDEEEDEPVKSKKPFARDTIMDLYDGHLNNFDIDTAPPPVPEKFTQPANKDTKHELPEDNLDTLQPRSIEILPHIPTEPASRTVTNNNLLPSLPRDAKPPAVPPKETLEAQVQMTYIQPATAQMTTMVTTKAGPSETVDRRKDPPTPAAVMNKPIAHQPSSESLRQRSPVTPDSGVPRPVSPRPAEVHHAPVPVAMSAVIQNNEYLNPHPPNQAPNLMDKSIKMDNAAPASTQAQGGNRTSPAIDPLSKSPLQRSMVDPPPSSSAQMPINHQVQHGRPPAPVMQSSLSSSTERLPPNSSPRLPPQQPVYPPQPHSPRPLGHRQPVNPPVANELGRHYYPPAAHPPRMISPPPRQGSSPLMAPPRVPMGSPSLGQPMHPVGVPRPAPSPVPNGYAMQAPSPVMRPSDRAPSPRPPNSVALENDQANAVRRVLFSHNQCEVFHWKDQSWYAVEGHCLLEVRQAFSNRTSVTVQLQNVGQMYLNAWILPTTVIRRPSQTDVSISVFMGPKKENYLVHFYNPNDCTAFANLLQRLHQNAVQMAAAAPPPPQSVRPESLMPEREELDIESLPQSLKPVMQCKCKLFSQNETSKWTNFGSVAMRISQQLPSKKMHIYIENDKNRLVSAIVRSSNVEKINNKRLSFLLVNEQDRTSMVYMIHMRDEETSNKIYHYLRTVNQSNGW
ncbi:uncharacterized protein BYT42DRAFT_564703 [Radiomyces spectabilis]|uniref:uncharacterized protein n=1 Tax=Radiomyces spectabilis TaxID=64574 RepID=UPI00222129E7|nr:uncharacterized protein BYT42DRAFT_564703 [Radiomyces spectabilis]KAI8380928.1 hypothetical protein BYT42DRAFT_564703 [Radiomyces spectabilis]